MNLLFWKHKKDGHVIKDTCKTKLPSTLQNHYHPTEEEPTHHYDDNTGSILTGVIAGAVIAEALNNDDSPAPNSSPGFDGFGGGDFGGGGSSGSFDTPDSGGNDSGNSYDSGSSYDSGNSYDSGSGSSDF